MSDLFADDVIPVLEGIVENRLNLSRVDLSVGVENLFGDERLANLADLVNGFRFAIGFDELAFERDWEVDDNGGVDVLALNGG